MNSKLFIVAMILLLCLPYGADAQSKNNRKKKPTKKELAEKKRAMEAGDTLSLMDHLSFDIRFGNIRINNGFSLSFKPGVGYNLNKYFAVGLGGKMYYDYFTNFNQPSISLFSLGGFGFGRIKIGNIYLQGEYNSTGFQNYYTDGVVRKTIINYPAVGGGYCSGNNKWRYGIELMLPLSKDARTFGTSLEYWINVAYNF